MSDQQGAANGRGMIPAEGQGETVTLTKELLELGQTGGAGFGQAQLEHLGVSWPPAKGWMEALVGKQVPGKTYRSFIAAKRAGSRQGAARQPRAPAGTYTVEEAHQARLLLRYVQAHAHEPRVKDFVKQVALSLVPSETQSAQSVEQEKDFLRQLFVAKKPGAPEAL